MATIQHVSKALDILRRTYPKEAQKMTFGLRGDAIERHWARTYAAYHAILQDIPEDVLQVAVIHLGCESQWFPTAAEIRQAAFSLLEKVQGTPSAQDAWAEVTQKMRAGFYDTSKGWHEPRGPTDDDWSCPLIQSAIDAIGGWHALRTSENAVADRARFLEAYNHYLTRARQDQRMAPLIAERLGIQQRDALPEPEHQVEREVAALAEEMRF